MTKKINRFEIQERSTQPLEGQLYKLDTAEWQSEIIETFDTFEEAYERFNNLYAEAEILTEKAITGKTLCNVKTFELLNSLYEIDEEGNEEWIDFTFIAVSKDNFSEFTRIR